MTRFSEPGHILLSDRRLDADSQGGGGHSSLHSTKVSSDEDYIKFGSFCGPVLSFQYCQYSIYFHFILRLLVCEKKSSLMWFPRYIQSYSPFPHPPAPSHTHILGHQPIFICFLNNYQIAYSFSPMFLYVNNFACFKNNKLCLTCHSTTRRRHKKNRKEKFPLLRLLP